MTSVWRTLANLCDCDTDEEEPRGDALVVLAPVPPSHGHMIRSSATATAATAAAATTARPTTVAPTPPPPRAAASNNNNNSRGAHPHRYQPLATDASPDAPNDDHRTATATFPFAAAETRSEEEGLDGNREDDASDDEGDCCCPSSATSSSQAHPRHARSRNNNSHQRRQRQRQTLTHESGLHEFFRHLHEQWRRYDSMDTFRPLVATQSPAAPQKRAPGQSPLRTATSYHHNSNNNNNSQNSLDDIPTISLDEVVLPGSLLQKQMAQAAAQSLRNSHDADHDDPDECVICMEGFDPTNPRMPTLCGCGHNKTYFHLPCLYQWIEQCPECPACRQTLRWQEF